MSLTRLLHRSDKPTGVGRGEGRPSVSQPRLPLQPDKPAGGGLSIFPAGAVFDRSDTPERQWSLAGRSGEHVKDRMGLGDSGHPIAAHFGTAWPHAATGQADVFGWNGKTRQWHPPGPLGYNGLVVAWPELTKLAVAERSKTKDSQQKMS